MDSAAKQLKALDARYDTTKHEITLVKADRILTMGTAVGDTVAVQADRVLAVGYIDDLRDQFPSAHLVDYPGSTIVPGFNDAHMHPSQVAEEGLHLDLSPDRVPTEDALVRAIKDEAMRVPTGQWIRSSRYDHGKTTGGRPIGRDLLDRIAPEHPVLVIHIASHWGVLNSKGLELAGYRDDSEPPRGGFFGRDGAGRLDGRVFEQALFDLAFPSLARDGTVLPASTLDDQLGGLERYLERFNSAGLTSVNDALAYPDAIRLYQEADRLGRLTARVGLLVAYPHFAAFRDSGIRAGFGSDMLRFNGIKGFVDGAVGGGTCLLEHPYEGRDDHGQQVLSDGELQELVNDVHSAGVRMGIHANGDRAIRKLLSAYRRAYERFGNEHIKHRIEHCSMVDAEIITSMRSMGLIAVPFGEYVRFHGTVLREWYGERLSRMFTHRWFLDEGVVVAGSSDFMCGPFEPLYAIQSCVTRAAESDGTVLGEEQRISVAEALWVYTVGSAMSTGEGDKKGRLMPGYLADFVVLGANPLSTASGDIAQIPVKATWVGGRPVWSAA